MAVPTLAWVLLAPPAYHGDGSGAGSGAQEHGSGRSFTGGVALGPFGVAVNTPLSGGAGSRLADIGGLTTSALLMVTLLPSELSLHCRTLSSTLDLFLPDASYTLIVVTVKQCF